jgi:hypothetical protein
MPVKDVNPSGQAVFCCFSARAVSVCQRVMLGHGASASASRTAAKATTTFRCAPVSCMTAPLYQRGGVRSEGHYLCCW